MAVRPIDKDRHDVREERRDSRRSGQNLDHYRGGKFPTGLTMVREALKHVLDTHVSNLLEHGARKLLGCYDLE